MNKILLLEDDLVASQTYKSIIEQCIPGIEVICVHNISDGLEKVKNNIFQVIIIDQKLNEGELGTDFLDALISIKNDSYKIMMSGESTLSTVSKALNSQLDDYLNKDNIKDLKYRILKGIAEYEKRIHSRPKKLLFEYRPKGIFSKKNKVYIISDSCKSKNYIFEDNWQEELALISGVDKEVKKEFKFNQSINIELGSNLDYKTVHGIDITKLSSKLESSLQSHVKMNTKFEDEYAITESSTQRLPDIPSNVDTDYIVTQIYKVNQIYEEYEIIIGIECSACKKIELIQVILYNPTNRITRQCHISYSNGEKKVINI